MARGGWNISREGDSTASLGSLGQGSVTLRGKKFFLGFSWSFLCSSLCPVPLEVPFFPGWLHRPCAVSLRKPLPAQLFLSCCVLASKKGWRRLPSGLRALMVELGKVNFVLQLSRVANWSLFSAVCWQPQQ